MSDVRRGHCWYCRKPGDKVPCSRCKIGVYCSQNCLGRDKRRHSSECQSFGPQKCNFCQKQLENRLECSSCGEAYYCDRTCQKKDWKEHKTDCKEVQEIIKDAGQMWSKIAEEFKYKETSKGQYIHYLPDFPFYFGNTMAADFLNLRQNEWQAPHRADDACLDRDYSVLSVGCGDIRSLVNTIAQLPNEFRGKLFVTMCDYDPFVMARNVLFLYMMVKYATKPDFSKTLASIWYSVVLSEHDYNLLHEALTDLCSRKLSLLDITKGLVEMNEEEVEVLSQVWSIWLGMECRCSRPDSIDLTNQRKERRSHLTCSHSEAIFSRKHINSYREWDLDGVIASTGVLKKDLTRYNPTLTGRKGWDQAKDPLVLGEYIRDKHQPKNMEYVYGIHASTPFDVWDFIEVEKYCDEKDSLPVMLHTYVSHMIDLAMAFIDEKRIAIQMTTTACQKLTRDRKFDRIFTSNLAEYMGVYTLVGMFGPLLDSSNRHSTLVMDTLSGLEVWEFMVGKMEYFLEEMNWTQMACSDEEEWKRDFVPHAWDYSYDSKWFLRYLKVLFMTSGFMEGSKVPSSKTVLQFGGLRMRDIRRELNTVVPYFYLKGPRKVASVNGRLRVMEWVLTENRLKEKQVKH
ncbi:uncharacterized protein [Amphiura filiformis]|uniref:uncharacterized protein isoform X3 n=1 Tax=Amphiura filiformis TaxID=82378 RepID=UPI003B20E9CB